MPLRALALGLALTWPASAQAFAACALVKVVDLPVTMHGLRPTIQVAINGTPEPLVVNSGAFISTLRPKTASDLKLPHLRNERFRGVGGIEYRSELTTVDTLTLSGQVLRDVQFLITPGGGVGDIGQNLLGRADVEYDFAGGAVRLFKSDGCPGSNMAYWVKGQDYSVLTINWMNERNPHTNADAAVNGAPVSVTFSSAVGMSSLSLGAARRIGLKIDGPGARYAGLIRGNGPESVKTWIVPVQSFKIGQEEIRNTELRVIDEAGPGLDADMILGADFFLSHRIYVANSQHKLYFTYNGGPVFRLDDPVEAKP
jgi:hypothetical protein